MIDEGLVALLAADAATMALTATRDAGSIYQGVTPPDATKYPCMAYKFVGGRSFPTADTTGGQRARLEVTCWGVAASDAKLLADAVRKALDGFSGQLSDGTQVSRIALLHPGIDFFSDDSLYFGRMLEFHILFTYTD